tara:strand:- start:6545 stop:6667 length:123 start_codon:yes stop_codon:yes gene_type:complete
MFLAIIIIIYQYNEVLKISYKNRKDLEAFRQQAKKCFYRN